jgi:hypothetical protein
MRFEVFIHDDDAMCFHVAIQGTQKMVVMGHHNFKDKVLIKIWQACPKMNGTIRTKINIITIESCFCLLSKIVYVFEVLKFTEA